MTLTTTEKKFARQHEISYITMLAIKDYFEGKKGWIKKFCSNPYVLMECDGFGFFRCDKLALKVGFDMTSMFRTKAYIEQSLMNSNEGNSIIRLDIIIDDMCRTLNIDYNKAVEALLSDSNKYYLLDRYFSRVYFNDIVCKSKEPVFITHSDWYSAEKFVYNWLKTLSKEDNPRKDGNIFDIIDKKYPTLNEQQKYVIDHILDKNINLLIGLGGSGKTYVTKIILDILQRHGYSYTLLTPTGISSFNLSEKTGVVSYTIHRAFYSQLVIDTDYVIIDEIGMCGYNHFNMLNKMIVDKSKTKPLFIGDKYQLPSIEAGDYLSSMMKLIYRNKVNGNVFELDKVMRVKDGKDIAEICSKLCGNTKQFDENILTTEHNGVNFYPKSDNLFEQIEQILKDNNWDLKETAIIMPQKKGKCGCDEFNKYIQSKNTSDIIFEDKFKSYKSGDILMHIKNNTSLDIYNGELVELIEFNGINYIAKKLYNGDIIEYPFKAIASETNLGYSFTVHKSQGCTIKNVIFIAIKEFTYMLSRNLMYVGMSRASDNLAVIYDKNTFVNSTYKSLNDKRLTFLGVLANR